MSRWRFINAAILMKFMGAKASEDVADEDNGDVEEDIVDRFLVRSNSDPGKKAGTMLRERHRDFTKSWAYLTAFLC